MDWIRFGQQKRAKTGSTPLGGGVSHHRELVGSELLSFAPIVATPRLMGRVCALGDDALEVALSCKAIRLIAIAFNV